MKPGSKKMGLGESEAPAWGSSRVTAAAAPASAPAWESSRAAAAVKPSPLPGDLSLTLSWAGQHYYHLTFSVYDLVWVSMSKLVLDSVLARVSNSQAAVVRRKAVHQV